MSSLQLFPTLTINYVPLGFFSRSALKMHGSSHSSDKPFECEYCGQRLNRRVHLRRHIRQFHEAASSEKTMNTATTNSNSNIPAPSGGPDEGVTDGGDPSLKCKLCGLQYNRQNNLTRHMLQIHHINVKGQAWKSRSYKSKHQNVSSVSDAGSELVQQDPSLSQGSGTGVIEPVNLHRDVQPAPYPGNPDLPPQSFEPSYYHGLNFPVPSTEFPVVPNELRALSAYSRGMAGFAEVHRGMTGPEVNSRPSAMNPFNFNRNLL